MCLGVLLCPREGLPLPLFPGVSWFLFSVLESVLCFCMSFFTREGLPLPLFPGVSWFLFSEREALLALLFGVTQSAAEIK